MTNTTPNTHDLASLEGVLEHIIYHNEENHFCIGQISHPKVHERITITGTLPGVQCGETLKLEGTWTHHPQHGRQFKVSSFESKLPSTVHGIRKYLGSGLIPGIGRTYADKIVDRFKEETLKVISEESARLREVPGIGAGRAKAIKKAWNDQHALRDVFMFLKTYSVSNGHCMRIVKTYGDEAIEILKTNPYRVAREITGIGFKTADKIALNLGLPNDGPQRIQAGLLFILDEYASSGHTRCEQDILEQKACEILDAPHEKVRGNLELLIQKRDLVSLPQLQSIQLPNLHVAEKSITESLGMIHHTHAKLPPIDIDKAVEWSQSRAGFEFAPEQTTALKAALSSKISVITGGPGTGKTTILRALVEILHAKHVRCMLAAPTGRAAQRMSQATGAFAQTIHRLLKYDPAAGGFVHDEDTPLATDFLIVDEASMLDTLLAKSLFRAIPASAHLVLVGDIHQLPSVGPGAVLHDVIHHGKLPTTSLQRIFRQGNQSSIVTTAHAILSGQAASPKTDSSSDLEFIKASSPEDCLEIVTKIYKKYSQNRSLSNPLLDVQVLAPMHKGVAGIANLNEKLQEALNPHSTTIPTGAGKFKVGDKVIQTRNNYDKGIFNGDLGRIASVNKDTGSLLVDFEEQRVEIERMEIPDLSLAYAISIHKSQGSEFPVAIITLLKQHFVMLKRNLLYTGITRGKKKVFLVGDPTAYVMAVNNLDTTTRKTALGDLLGRLF